MHLKTDELVDIAEGTRSESSAPHLAGCEPCRAQVNELRAMMSAARDVDVPEPSPLFWDHLSSRVREAVAAEAVPRRRWLAVALWRRGVLNPLSAVAVAGLLLAVVVKSLVTVPAPISAPPRSLSPTRARPPSAERCVVDDDPSLTLVPASPTMRIWIRYARQGWRRAAAPSARSRT
jgi:hypothetical protein